MEEINTKLIILSTSDFGEADKIASAFSLDFGKISIKFNGVRKQNAKLKFLTQPFSYVDIECFKRGDFYTAKTGALIHNFPKILTNYPKTICAYIMMEVISKIMPKNKAEPELFLLTIDALDALENEYEQLVTINFILKFFDILGENLMTDINSNHIFLDLDVGNFSAEKTMNCIEIDKKCYNLIKTIKDNQNFINTKNNKTTSDEIYEIVDNNKLETTLKKHEIGASENVGISKDDVALKKLEDFTHDTRLEKMTLKMLHNIFRAKYDTEINSFSFL